ncbi:MAG TPA: cell division protein FtsZ [Conexibacter sp.]|jgi:cell division protein FtsZ
MREGPLAALFRRTEDEGLDGAGTGVTPAAATQEAAPREPSAREPEAARARERAPAPTHMPEPTPEAAPRRASEPFAFEDEAASPTPQERLRQAFSVDIPENILDAAPSASGHDSERVYTHVDEPGLRSIDYGVGRARGPVLRVVGVGGGGVNAVNRMVEAEVHGVEFLAVNTDLQSLQQSAAHLTLHIGAQVTRGLGSGSDPSLGSRAAMEEYDKIKSLLKGSDMIFITAGEGGGTGTGAAPIVARIAREVGALTVGIVTKPFGFEGSRRKAQADEGIEALAAEVDTLIVVPNNRLLSVLDRNTSMVDAFRVADDVLRQGVQGISDLVTLPGLINLDFADVRTIMAEAGSALLGIGMGSGDRRAIDAAEQAVASPLLETSMEGARSILLSITGGHDLSLWEVNEAAKAVSEAAHPDANIIFGAMVDEKLDDQVWVTVVATGYGEMRPPRPSREELLAGGEIGRGRDERAPAAPREQPAPARSRFADPAGEVRVSRTSSEPHSHTGQPAERGELHIPEFIPHR